ncbi:MAG: amidohydrolase family protein [Okeania sp. SIO2D1]|nr:amidohydrolase family protein [Okeania sp. SIO2D1]
MQTIHLAPVAIPFSIIFCCNSSAVNSCKARPPLLKLSPGVGRSLAKQPSLPQLGVEQNPGQPEPPALRTRVRKWLPKQIKLFADGAIFSQLMQLQDPYLDGHEGEWIAKPEEYKAAFKRYWEADYQIHAHVNGDEGLRMVIETLAENMKTYPRQDHRFTVVHFAVSTEEQVKALKELGAIVSANPYYVTALADKYSKEGLGPTRAQNMVRLGSVAEAGMAIGLHSDMPMAPADMLFLAWCAVNRMTPENIYGIATHQCISIERALSAVTIEAAYFMGLDDEIGSIKPQKKANFAILEEDPLQTKNNKLKDIPIWGCVFEGEVKEYPLQQRTESEPVTAIAGSDLKKLNLAQMAASRG